jgi:hypothetical protein
MQAADISLSPHHPNNYVALETIGKTALRNDPGGISLPPPSP